MNRFTALLLVTICLLPSQLSAQSIWRYFARPDWGLSVFMYDYEEKATLKGDPLFDDNMSFAHLGATLGFNLPVYFLDDEISLGINPNFALSAANRTVGNSYDYSAQEQTMFLSLELPWYATIKFGTDASYKGSKFPLGAALGIGYHYSFLLGISNDFSENFGVPSAMAEISVGERKGWGLLKLRYTHTLAPHEIDYSEPSRGLDHTLTIRNSGIHLLYVSNY